MQEHSASLDLAAGRAAQTGIYGGPLPHGRPAPEAASLGPEHEAAEARPFTVRDRRFWARDASDAAGDADPARAERPTYVRELEDKLAQAEARAAATLAQYQEARGDFAAARARMARELGREAEAGRRSFLAGLLDVVDNLDRAISAAHDTAGHEGSAIQSGAQSLLAGVTMVQSLFLAKLAQCGVGPMSCLGARFDAQRHEALATTEVTEAQEEGLVQSVVREGYLLNDTTLRTAQVTVGALIKAPAGEEHT